MGDDVDRARESVHSAKVHALLGGHVGSLDRRSDPERAAKAVRVVDLVEVDVTVHIDGLAPVAAGAA